MFCGQGDGVGKRGFVCGQDGAEPDSGDGDVGLHVHAVGAVVRAGDVAQGGVVEVGDVGPEGGFHGGGEGADVRGGGVVAQQGEAVEIDSVVGGGVVLGEGIVGLEEGVDGLVPGVGLGDLGGVVMVMGGEVPEGTVHEGDVGVGGGEAVLVGFAEDGVVDGLVEAGGERGGDAVGELGKDDLEGGADEVAPVGVVLDVVSVVGEGGGGLFGRAFEGAEPGGGGVGELVVEDGGEDGGGTVAVAGQVAEEEAEGEPAGLAHHVGADGVAVRVARFADEVEGGVEGGFGGAHGVGEELAGVGGEGCEGGVAWGCLCA